MKANWQIKKLGEIANVQGGGTPPTNVPGYFQGDINWYTPTEIPKSGTATLDESVRQISDEATRFTKISPAGTVLLSSRATIGPVGITSTASGYNQGIKGIEPIKDIADPWYVANWLQANRDELISRASGTTFKEISTTEVKNLDIPVPPLPEQKKIVKILDEIFENLDKAKENTVKNLQDSKELFESSLKSLFANRGIGWNDNKLGDLCEMISRGISPKYTESSGLCVLNQKCIRDHKIDFNLSRLHNFKLKKVSEDKFITIGDVLVNSTGVGTLGRVAQVRELSTQATVDSHITIVRPAKGKFYNDFFGYALIYIEKEIAMRGEGASGQTELARDTLKNDFKICYPTLFAKQKEIVKKLDELSDQTKKLEKNYGKKLLLLEELRKSVLAKAFRGEL